MGAVTLIAVVLTAGACTTTGAAGGRSASGSGTRPLEVGVDQRVRAGQLLRDAGQLDAALNEFNRALQVNPNSVDAVIGVGRVQHDRKQYTAARQSFDRAVQLDGNRFDARYYLGLMQQVLGETGEAIINYRRALQLNPDDPDAHRDLATAYLQVGRPDLALEHAKVAVRLAPSSQPAWCNLAATYSLMGRYRDALECYRTATEFGELDEPVLMGLGDTHLKLGNIQRASNTLEALVRKTPSAVAYERLGYTHFLMREFDIAEDQYRRALTYDPDETGALNGLGACRITQYAQQKNSRDKRALHEALAAWRRSLRLRPNQPQIIDLLARYDLPD